MTRGRILYVEDNVENRMLVKRILEAEGYEVLEAENGTVGMEKAKAASPDLILVDINLPDIDGYDVTARLRQTDRIGSIPIVALTANVMEGDRQKALDAGCDGYIPKPIDVDHLTSIVAQFLRKGSDHKAAAPVKAVQPIPVTASPAPAAAPTLAPARAPAAIPVPSAAVTPAAASGQSRAVPPPSAQPSKPLPPPPPSFKIPPSIKNAPPPPPVRPPAASGGTPAPIAAPVPQNTPAAPAPSGSATDQDTHTPPPAPGSNGSGTTQETTGKTTPPE
jgi:two-component system cell cycle response regulator DivK